MKKVILSLLTLTISITLLLGISEFMVRMAGYEPWTYSKRPANEPTMHEPDPYTGWKNKAGDYRFPAYAQGHDDIHITFLQDGSRVTGSRERIGDRELLALGGSFTQGWAISNQETWPWKLQQRLPSFKVSNFGTGGFGTVQSLLVLKREIAGRGKSTIVLYGFIPHHEIRNVAPPSWAARLTKNPHKAHADLPYATLSDDGKLLLHPPKHYLAVPFREHSALAAFLGEQYEEWQGKGRMELRGFVTQGAMLEMDRIARDHGADYVVVFLTPLGKGALQHYVRYFDEHNIRYLNCAQAIQPHLRVPGERHPNGKMNTRWAKCIGDGLAKQGLVE